MLPTSTKPERTLSWVTAWGGSTEGESGAGSVALTLQSLQGFQGGLQGLQDGIQSLQSFQGLQQGLLARSRFASPRDEKQADGLDTDWEEALKRQNLSNDELCSENSRLQLELERLRGEEEAATGSSLLNEEPLASKDDEEQQATLSIEEELMQSTLNAVRDVLAASCLDKAAGHGEKPANPAEAEEDGSGGAELTKSIDGACMLGPAWEEEMVGIIKQALEDALREDAHNSDSSAAVMTPEEEMALLVGEKMAVREMVERQQERIEVLENELRDLASSEPAALASVFSGSVARGLSDAGGALTAGLSAVLAPKGATASKETVNVGGEYEIISGRGAIVRCGDSLRSEVVTELPPGSRVRILTISTKYPRRVEIIFVPRDGPTPDHLPVGADALTETTATPMPTATGGRKGVVGWISASSKDGRFLIRAASTPLKAEPDRADGDEGKDSEVRASNEMASESNDRVTLSAEEWECLNEANAASVQRVADLTSQLGSMGCELVQSFEMRSVLAQLQQGLRRDLERSSSLRESAAMAVEELEQHRRDAKHAAEVFAKAAAVEALVEPEVAGGSTPKDCSESSVRCSDDGVMEVSSKPLEDVETPSKQSLEAKEPHLRKGKIDAEVWDRLLSERETTAAALSAGLQRLKTLAREAEDLQRDLEAAEGKGQGELVSLRETLRRRLFGKRSAGTKGSSSSRQPAWTAAAAAASHSLFKHRSADLLRTIQELQVELQLATEGELALRRSLSARSNALRNILYRAATAGLHLPQCGPVRIPVDPGAERAALVEAVQEQLRWNLRLQGLAGSESVEDASLLTFN